MARTIKNIQVPAYAPEDLGCQACEKSMVVCELVKAIAIPPPPPEDMSMPDMLLLSEEVGMEAMLMEVVVDIDDMSIFGGEVRMWLIGSC